MNISQKIYLNDDNKNYDRYIKVKLEQDIESIEFLSLRVNSNDIYQSFNADYGVLVGRVIANNGIGVPNAKISIFIPLTDDDVYNEDVAYIYPYKNPRDKNNEGKRYNLLPRVAKVDESTGITRPQQPFGSFPIKEEIVMNQKHLDVYKKYYKYTALTNQYGDYMIFGTPIGTQIIHMSLDITDIGKYSMTPASMVTNLGYSEKLFTNNNTRIKPSDDLNDLPHIETQDITVDIIPFWGDVSTYEIGITRQDFRVRTTLNNTFTIFGNIFTDGIESMWGKNYINTIAPSEFYRINDYQRPPDVSSNITILSKRTAVIDEKIYYYPPDVTDEEINTGGDIFKKMLILDKSEYSRYIQDGLFTFIINCNRDKVIYNDENIEQLVPYDFNGGIFTKFRGFVVFEVVYNSAKMDFYAYLGDVNGARIEPRRYKIKIPQTADLGDTFNMNDDILTDDWRNQNFIFTGGTIYSISRFHGLTYDEHDEGSAFNDLTKSSVNNVGIIKTSSELIYKYYIEAYYVGTLADGLPHITPYPDNPTILENYILSGYTVNNPYNGIATMTISYVDDIFKDKFMENNYEVNGEKFFGAEWLNMSLYFPQMSEAVTGFPKRTNNVKSCNLITINTDNIFYYDNNNQEIAGGDTNTKLFARSDLNKTTFITLTKEDINYFMGKPNNGFIETSTNLSGSYANTGGTNYYFYKGFGVDCIQYLRDVGIV